MRSPRLKRRPERLLYSGNIPVTPTSGSDFSRWPPFMWQLLHDIPPGASRGVSCGVFVKILKPRLISSDSGDVSSEASASGVLGNSHAATIVALAAMSGPFICAPLDVCAPGPGEHATARWPTTARHAPAPSVLKREWLSVDTVMGAYHITGSTGALRAQFPRRCPQHQTRRAFPLLEQARREFAPMSAAPERTGVGWWPGGAVMRSSRRARRRDPFGVRSRTFTRRSSADARRRTRPRDSSRSTSPVTFDASQASVSASWPIGIGRPGSMRCST